MATRTKPQTGSRMTVPNESSFFEDEVVQQPYAVEFEIEGIRDYVFNRYDVPVKGSKQGLKGENETDDIGRKVTLDPDGHLAHRTVALWNAVVNAGKYRKNPRSARGSYSVILKEGMEIESMNPDAPDLLTFIGPNGKPYSNWEWEFTARTKNAGAFAGYVTKVRPGIHMGWRLQGRAVVLLPEYISVGQLHECFSMAGRFGGIGDARNGGLGFGRFLVRRFEQADEV